MDQRKIDFFGLKYDHLVFFFIVGVMVQLLLDSFETVHYGVVFVYTLLPNIAAPIPKYNHKLYKYNRYIPIVMTKSKFAIALCVAFILNSLISGYVKYNLLLINNETVTFNLFWDVLDKTPKWMGIHAVVTGCIVYLFFNVINKMAGIKLDEDKKRVGQLLTVVCCLFSVLIMTPAGSIGYLFREKINNSAAVNKYSVANNSKEQKESKSENNVSISNNDSVSTKSTVVNNSTVVNISTVVNNPKIPNNPIKAFIVDSLIITVASSILSAVIVHCLLLILDCRPRDYILRNLDKIVASAALLHISTGFVTAVGNFSKEHKFLLIVFSFIQFYLLFLAGFRITLFIINSFPNKYSFLSEINPIDANERESQQRLVLDTNQNISS